MTPAKNHINTLLVAALALMLTCALTLFSCGGRTGSSSAADTARLKKLRTLDDSIVKLAPSALGEIKRGLNTASDSMTYYEYRLCLARYYWLSEKPQLSSPIVDQIIDFGSRHNDSGNSSLPGSNPRLNSLIAGAYACRAALWHNFHREPRRTVELYRTALTLLAHSDNMHNMPKTCANLADAYIQCNDIPAAAKCYRRALFLVDSLQLPASENVTLYMGLAQIYMSLGDNNKALHYYEATEKHFDSMAPSMQAYYLCSRGNLYYYSQRYSNALDMFKRMKRQLERNGMQKNFDMYLCKVNMADVYLNLDSLEQSERCLDEVEPFFNEADDPTAIYYCHTIRLGIAVKRGDMGAARRLLNADKTRQDDVAYLMVSIRNRYVQRYYELTGNYRQALATLKDDIRYNDSLEHNRSNMRSAEIMERFRGDTLQLHHELAIEHKNAAIQHANMLVAIAVAACLLIALATTAWIMHLRRRQSEDHMNIIALKLANMRNRISPHFVFNVLNNKIGSSDNKEAGELTALSKLIRTNLDMSMSPCISLEREIDFVRKYVEVERYLMGDDFTFRLEIPEHLDMTRIIGPSMFLQILTENAIVHGLRGWDGHKELSIRISREPVNPKSTSALAPMQTVLRVADNGPGFNIQRLRKKTGLGVITQTIAATNERNSHKMRFDIHNITDRLGRVLGCEAVLKVPDGMKF